MGSAMSLSSSSPPNGKGTVIEGELGRALATAPPPIKVVVRQFDDPFEALLAAEGNEARAAELCGCTSLVDFYRKLEQADPEKIHRGMQGKLAVTLSQLLSTVQGRLIERIEDKENPISDNLLVQLLTKTIPALSGLLPTLGAQRPPESAGDQFRALQAVVKDLPEEFRSALLGELGDDE